MLTRADTVRVLILVSEACLQEMGRSLHAPNEIVETLWFRIAQYLDDLDVAERYGDEIAARENLKRILKLLSRIEEEFFAAC